MPRYKKVEVEAPPPEPQRPQTYEPSVKEVAALVAVRESLGSEGYLSWLQGMVISLSITATTDADDDTVLRARWYQERLIEEMA